MCPFLRSIRRRRRFRRRRHHRPGGDAPHNNLNSMIPLLLAGRCI